MKFVLILLIAVNPNNKRKIEIKIAIKGTFFFHNKMTQGSKPPQDEVEEKLAADQTRFFTEMLSDVDEPSLPFGLGDIDPGAYELEKVQSKIPPTLNNQLRAHAQNFQVSVASMCHLAWAQVLAKGSGREVVVFGTVLFDRLQAEDEGNDDDVIGLMIKTLPIRINIDGRNVERVKLTLNWMRC